MGKGIYEFVWDQGHAARWVREPDGHVHYYRDLRLEMTLCPAGWAQLVAAMDTDSLRTDQLPIFGEIIGWRCWRYNNGRLWSLHQAQSWEPHEVNEGHVGETKGGIYAFKTKGRAVTEAIHDERNWPIVVGSVMLWGDAIEAENGWRASYAKIISLDEIRASKAARETYTVTKVVRKATFWRDAKFSEENSYSPEHILAYLREQYLSLPTPTTSE